MNIVVLPRGVRLALAALLVTAGLSVPFAAPASAAEAPVDPVDVVGADVLPTWQIDGVVWSQAVIGNTVYVTGSFSKARPPGVPVGGAGEVPAANIFAYDVRTGNPVPSFSHALNAQGLVIRGSADGTRVYVGGDFTTVDGVARGHVAAFSTATGDLLPWAANIGGQVRGLAVTDDTVYVGGNYPSANGVARTSLAAFRVSDAQMTSWAPTAEGTGGYVWAMVMSPDRSQVIVGGSFSTLNGQAAYGMGALDAATGATRPWAAQERIRAAGLNGGITSLKADATTVYGSAYAYGSGATFEGTFAADPDGGAIRWVNDCLGDTYDVEPFAGALYSVSHSHNCSAINEFPDTSPRSRWQKAMASSLVPTGTITVKDAYGWDYRGLPYAGHLQWYPDLDFGKYTPDRQAAWSVEGGGDYLVLGGEFPGINGAAQQGLARFLKKSIGPHSNKPLYSAGMNPVATSTESGTVRVRFNATWDRDDSSLRYDVYRDGGASIGNLTAESIWWSMPPLLFTDTGLVPGSSHKYQIRAKDAAGNTQWSASTTLTVSGAAPDPYLVGVRSDGASHLWRFESGGSPGVDSIGAADLTVASTSTGPGVSGGSALTSGGGTSPQAGTSFAESRPQAVTLEAWVKTTSTRGGRIVGLGSAATGNSSLYDLALYLGNDGRVNFGVRNAANALVTTRSSTSVNDGSWHHVAAIVDEGGSTIVVDGRRAGRSQSAHGGPPLTGYWRVLGDQTSGLANRPSDAALSGSVDEVAVYPSALPIEKVQAHFASVSGSSPVMAAPTDAYGARVMQDAPDAFWRLGETGGSTAKDTSASAGDATYAGVAAYGRPGAVGGPDTAVVLNGTSGYVSSQDAWGAPTEYTTEAWFQTSTTRGGRIIGFGSSASASVSSSYDRMVCMRDDGRLSFGAYDGQQQTVTTPVSYNDGSWHHVVASQGPDGMKLYVDGVECVFNDSSTCESYTGYWRAGGDRCWAGTTSRYLAGALDELAVYPRVLSAATVADHFTAGGGQLANRPPTPAFTTSASYLSVAMDGTSSADVDGTIASYAWTFGDGGTASGPTPTHAYAVAGTYAVTLTVTDDDGATATTSRAVTVVANQAPTAAFTRTVTGLGVALDAATSADPDGTIASYAWTFGDGSSATGRSASHTYPSEGTYTVALTVTDDQGATASTTQSVTVTRPPNQSPTAAFTSSSSMLAVAVDGSGSADPDGTLASYDWTFGDGSSGTGRTTSHTYAAAGTYTVTLTVTDDRGGSGSVSRSVTVAANQAPTAVFTSALAARSLTVDASGSSDPDGIVASYDWDFGDGTSGTGRTASHTYSADGSYTVRLTVTDDGGAAATTTRTVSVVADPSVARDSFERTATGGWGTADRGGDWTVSGTKSRYVVASGAGAVTLGAGAGGRATLGAVSLADTEVAATVSTDVAPTGGGQYVSVLARSMDANSEYRGKILFTSSGSVYAYLTTVDGGVVTTLASSQVPGLTYTAGTQVRVRMQVVGASPTTVRIKVWVTGQPEPSGWLLSATDTTPALQSGGSVGFYPYLSGSAAGTVTYRLDDVWVGPLQP